MLNKRDPVRVAHPPTGARANRANAETPESDDSASSGRGGHHGRESTVLAMQPAARERFPSLDGYRALCIALLLAIPASEAEASAPIEWLVLLRRLLENIGVQNFFVLSGFVITLALLDEEARAGIDLIAFYGRRVVRILPVYLSFVAVVVALDVGTRVSVDLCGYVTALTFTKNYGCSQHIDSHLWSIAVETQFYLLWPAIMVMAGRRRRWHAALVMVVAAPLFRTGFYLLRDWKLRFLSFPANMDLFMFGAAAGALVSYRPPWFTRALGWWPLLGRVAALLVFCAVWLLQEKRQLAVLTVPFASSTQALCTAYLIASLVIVRGGVLWTLLNCRPVRYAGLASYSIYVWHQLFFVPSDYYTAARLVLLRFPYNVVAATFVGLASYRLLEAPLRARYGRRPWAVFPGHRIRDGILRVKRTSRRHSSTASLSDYWLPKESIPLPVAIVFACQLSGCLLASTEIAYRWATGSVFSAADSIPTVAVLIVAGTALGIVSASIELVRRLSRLDAKYFYPVLLALPIYGLGLDLSSGAWISRQTIAPYGPAIVALLAGAALWIGIRLLKDLASQWPAIAVFGACAVVLALVDLLWLAGLYPLLHAALLFAAWIAGGVTVARLLLWLNASKRYASLRERLYPQVLTAVLSLSLASIALVLWAPPDTAQRLQWTRPAGYATQVYEPAHVAFQALQRGRTNAGVGYAELVNRWIEQQSDSRELSQGVAIAAWENAKARNLQDDRAVAPTARPDVLIITVDALRADVASEGHSFTELARRGVLFRRAYAPAATTECSLPRMLSGEFNVRGNSETVIHALDRAGYDTVFVTENAVREFLRARGQGWIDDPAVALGTDSREGRSASALSASALTYVRSRKSSKPLFLWIHYYDVHQWREITVYEEHESGTASQRYDWVWRGQDDEIGKFVAAAEKLLRPQPVIIVTSDHGEYLGEYGRTGHGRWIDFPVVHIPLIVIAPGVVPGVVDRPVGLFDVAATIAELCGLQGFATDGIGLLRRDVDPMRPLLLEAKYEIGIVRGPHRLALSAATGALSLFDDTDPREPVNLALKTMPELRTDLLLPLLGSPAAEASTSPLKPY